MPYILSPIIHTELPGLWGEGSSYERRNIYDVNSIDPKLPPVNYDAHTLKPHSISHIDFPLHVLPGGSTCDRYFEGGKQSAFYGPVLVVQLDGAKWTATSKVPGHYLWEVGLEELKTALLRVSGVAEVPSKLFLTARDVPLTPDGFHDPRYVLVLSEAAAEWLVSNPGFNAYGTSWKSSDFKPGSRERPIHKILLRQAVLFECLKLDCVPEGKYFLSGFPLPLRGASESPCCAVLFTAAELTI